MNLQKFVQAVQHTFDVIINVVINKVWKEIEETVEKNALSEKYLLSSRREQENESEI